MKIPSSDRLRFDVFKKHDATALATLLADPEITRNITANGSTPERCLASAHKRIDWHNGYWASHGYGVWALRARDPRIATENPLMGWCGFVPPENDADDPEILYGLGWEFRRKGLATEAARHTISWLFNHTDSGGVSAVISSKLNPGSVKLALKLGMRYRRRMDFSEFISNPNLARDVLAFEIWRLGEGPESDIEVLVVQTAYRAGQLVNRSGSQIERVNKALTDALSVRCANNTADLRHYLPKLRQHLNLGMAAAYMDCYHLSRQSWTAKPAGGA